MLPYMGFYHLNFILFETQAYFDRSWGVQFSHQMHVMHSISLHEGSWGQ